MLKNRKIGFTQWFLLIFIWVFILTIPFQYTFLPSTGMWFKPVIKEICFFFFGQNSSDFYSDSPVMFQWVILVAFFSLILALTFSFLIKEKNQTIAFLLNRTSVYYLALVLLIYGFNKVFCYQFPPPEPNILYTPLGQLSTDFLYWTSMSSSPGYMRFMGIIEVIPALLLFFPKTRLLGGMIALGVFINVAAINFGFGITVKIQSTFLLMLCLIVLFPYRNRLKFIFTETTTSTLPLMEEETPQWKWYSKWHKFFKPLIIGFILFESLAMYFEDNQFNGQNLPKPEEYGTYHLASNPQNIRRVFFHSQGYFITQSNTDLFQDYTYTLSGSTLWLNDGRYHTELYFNEVEGHYFFKGNFLGENIHWIGEKERLKPTP